MSGLRETAASLRQATILRQGREDLDAMYEFLSQEEKVVGVGSVGLHLERALIEEYGLSEEKAKGLVEKYLFDTGSRGPE